MKKNHTMRAATLLLVLTLITSCFVGGTFAKYTTQIAGSDTARVAKFGVELATDSDMFDKEYDGTGAISVQSVDNVIAPGTKGDAAIFTVSGVPEVDVQVTISLDGKDNANPMTMVTLPAGDYKDWTDVTDPNLEYNLAADYKPVLWTLTKNGTAVTGCENVNLDVINTYLEDTLSDKYEVESAEFANIVGAYALSWNWDFDADDNINTVDVTDKYDTTLGQIAAGVEDATGLTGYVANESFNFYMRVEQVD